MFFSVMHSLLIMGPVDMVLARKEERHVESAIKQREMQGKGG